MEIARKGRKNKRLHQAFCLIGSYRDPKYSRNPKQRSCVFLIIHPSLINHVNHAPPMVLEQLYTNCLAEAAYYLESNGEAVIVDPLRETQPYLDLLAERGAKLKYVLETHFHADFVSGHIDLAKATGATIVYGPNATTHYAVHNAADGEVLSVGDIQIKVLHTPGHTPESSCYLVHDESGKPTAILTGDTLFVGDVGRPDLLDNSGVTAEELAGQLYDSLKKHIHPLADDVIVYPAHGPGSACGKNIGKETFSTIGQQKLTNYALQPQTKEEFITKVTDGLAKPPAYFFADARINKEGYEAFTTVMERGLKGLSVNEILEAKQSQKAVLLDVRHHEEFEVGHIPQSLFIGLDGQFAPWVGALLPIDQPLVVIAPQGREEETVRRLARVGYEKVVGYLEGGFEVYVASGQPVEKINTIEPTEVPELVNHGRATILDVRKPGEVESGHVAGALSIGLGDLTHRGGELDPATPYAVHCAGGYRSVIAASILQGVGFTNILNIRGGWGKIKETDVKVAVGTPNNPSEVAA